MIRCTPLLTRFLALACLIASASPRASADPPRTIAEKRDFQATSPHADVVAFCNQLAKEAPRVRLGELGVSVEGRKLPLIILADPPVASAERHSRPSAGKRSNERVERD